MLTTSWERINCDFWWVALTTYANKYIVHRDCALLEIEVFRNWYPLTIGSVLLVGSCVLSRITIPLKSLNFTSHYFNIYFLIEYKFEYKYIYIFYIIFFAVNFFFFLGGASSKCLTCLLGGPALGMNHTVEIMMDPSNCLIDTWKNLIYLYKFLRLRTLGYLIEFKHIVALTNETQIMLSFSRIFKFNVLEFN